MNETNRKLKAVILAGGKGTRLSSVVKDVPKPLALVEGRPFLDYILDELAAGGIVLGEGEALHRHRLWRR